MSSAIGKALLLPLIRSLTIVAISGLIAVGISGLVADGFGALFGTSFVSGDQPGVTYTPSRCADLLEYQPEAVSCEAAATAHHFDEVVQYRVALGVLGLLGGLAAYVLYRRFRSLFGASSLPEGFTSIAGVTLYGFAACVLLGESLAQLAFNDSNGAGSYLSGGLVSLLLFAGYALAFWRTVRPRLLALA